MSWSPDTVPKRQVRLLPNRRWTPDGPFRQHYRFVRVAESGGFSAADRCLNLSKATVSDQVQALEDTLGARLLNRTTRRVSLTEVGRGYYDRCVQILHDLREADEAASTAAIRTRAAPNDFRMGLAAILQTTREGGSRRRPL